MDKTLIKKNFSRSASRYDDGATLQRRITERLLQKLERSVDKAVEVLDIGCGTGFLTSGLAVHWPAAEVTGLDLAHGMVRQTKNKFPELRLLTADAEKIPFKDQTFNLVVSSSTYQWVENLIDGFREVRRILKPGGQFIFSTFGERTLRELKHALSGWGSNGNLLRFPRAQEIGGLLIESGFPRVAVRSELVEKEYLGVAELLWTLKDIGASYAGSILAEGLGARKRLRKLEEEYSKVAPRQNIVSATFEVVWAEAVAAGPLN